VSVTTLAADWESYRRGVLPAEALPVQVSECRRAFYAGAWAALTTMTLKITAIEDDALCEAELAGLLRECEQFAKDVEAGNT
jgi:hypothetical protein